MSGHKITGFLGVIPRTAERLLPDMAAQICENAILSSGEIRPMRKPYQAYVPPVVAQMFAAYRAFDGTTEKWRTWQVDVDVVKAAISPDVEQRYYWTGDGCPRYATFTNFGATDWALGLPAPTTVLTVTPSGGSGATVSRFYVYTLINDKGEESGPNTVSALTSGNVDGTWTISGFSAAPTNDRVIAYNQTGLKQRLYRTAGDNAAFQLVAERAASAANWADTTTDATMLGDDMMSDGWAPPPVALKGLISLPNGALAGFYKNQLCFSEPYQPHTWPTAYRFQCESDIVGIAAYGTTVVACTKTRPYVADGVEPSSVTLQAVSEVWPCLSKGSVCSVGDGVVFATKHGQAYVGMQGSSIMTRDIFTVEEWAPMDPATMNTRVANGRLYIRYKAATSAQAQLLRIDRGEAAQVTVLTADCNALYVDPLNGELYVISKEVYLHDSLYGSRNVFVWRSKEIELQQPLNLGAGLIEWVGTMSETEIQSAYALRQLDINTNQATIDALVAVGAFNQIGFNTDPVNGAFGIINPRAVEEYVTYSLLDHGVPVASVDVLPGRPFRLPAGYKTDVVAHQLTGNVRVKYLKVAETMDGLRQV